jgi:hypothetical protein
MSSKSFDHGRGANDPGGSANCKHRGSVACGVGDIDWEAATAELNAYGAAALGPLLPPDECTRLAALYDEESRVFGIQLQPSEAGATCADPPRLVLDHDFRTRTWRVFLI